MLDWITAALCLSALAYVMAWAIKCAVESQQQ